jgi:hypothetical protein
MSAVTMRKPVQGNFGKTWPVELGELCDKTFTRKGRLAEYTTTGTVVIQRHSTWTDTLGHVSSDKISLPFNTFISILQFYNPSVQNRLLLT